MRARCRNQSVVVNFLDKKRYWAKEIVDDTRSTIIASASRLDKYIAHPRIKVTAPPEFESYRATAAAAASKHGATITGKLQDHVNCQSRVEQMAKFQFQSLSQSLIGSG